jgi:hypothetical protein
MWLLFQLDGIWLFVVIFIISFSISSGSGRTEFFYDEFMLHRLEKEFHIFLRST